MNAAMLAGLVAQAEVQGHDLVTLRALVEEATEAGAARAMARLGLDDAQAVKDIGELRQLLEAWRDAKKSARAAVIGWAVKAVLAAVLVGLAVKLGLTGLLSG
jgi:hypothetical protein